MTSHPVQVPRSGVCLQYCMYDSKSVFMCVFAGVMCCALLPTAASRSPPCAPPYLGPMEIHRGQGIWGEEHREAALHNLKGILMNRHSRAPIPTTTGPKQIAAFEVPSFYDFENTACVCVEVCVVVFVFDVR